jgi:hypothetical protein
VCQPHEQALHPVLAAPGEHRKDIDAKSGCQFSCPSQQVQCVHELQQQPRAAQEMAEGTPATPCFRSFVVVVVVVVVLEPQEEGPRSKTKQCVAKV